MYVPVIISEFLFHCVTGSIVFLFIPFLRAAIIYWRAWQKGNTQTIENTPYTASTQPQSEKRSLLNQMWNGTFFSNERNKMIYNEQMP